MPTRSLPLLLVVLALASVASAQPPAAVATPDDPDKSVVRALAVQQALSQGRALLREGKAGEAVAVLEKELPHIDGNAQYLSLLRDAYVGYVKELQLQRKDDRVAVYQRKLRILDPTASTSSPPPAPPAAVLAAPKPIAPEPTPPPPDPGPLAQPTPTPPAPPERLVRAKGEEDDPFQQVPADQGRSAMKLVAQADAAFQHQDYAAAGRLYRQAAQDNPSTTADHAEQIAYCRLAAVVEYLNKPSASASSLAELERETAAAIKQSPHLEAFGKKVLAQIHRRQGKANSAATEGATEPAVDGWTVLESANFRICHHGTPELAAQVSQAAEQARQAAFVRWFGSAGGANWSPRCTVYLHADGAAYAQATGTATASGHRAIIKMQGGRVVSRQLDLRADDMNLLPDTLPHETTHVVLADLFSDGDLPRWADEGMAVQAESPAHRELYHRALERFAHKGRFLNLGELMQQPGLPTDPAAATEFFVESVSLVEFLTAQKGPQAFALFLKEAPRRGYAACLQRHFGYHDAADLQAAWQRYLSRGAPAGAGTQ